MWNFRLMAKLPGNLWRILSLILSVQKQCKEIVYYVLSSLLNSLLLSVGGRMEGDTYPEAQGERHK